MFFYSKVVAMNLQEILLMSITRYYSTSKILMHWLTINHLLINARKKAPSVKKFFEMSRNNDYKTGNFLDYSHHQHYYKLIGIDLSRQRKYDYSSTNNFHRKIRRTKWCNNIFYCWKEVKSYSKIFFRFINFDRWI